GRRKPRGQGQPFVRGIGLGALDSGQGKGRNPFGGGRAAGPVVWPGAQQKGRNTVAGSVKDAPNDAFIEDIDEVAGTEKERGQNRPRGGAKGKGGSNPSRGKGKGSFNPGFNFLGSGRNPTAANYKGG